MACDKALSVQALFDGELDAAASLEIERHIEGCVECAALTKDLAAGRAALREHAPYHRADAALRARIANAVAAEAGARRTGGALFSAARAFWSGAIGGAAASALATAALFVALMAPAADPLLADLTGAHVRSLMADHLIDVASSDHHTVKPWFAGHADVSPPVADFESEGFKLVGGRADYIDGRRAAVVVYRHGNHVINVFAWAGRGEAPASESERNGYHIVSWRMGDLILAAVSDAAVPEMENLRRLITAEEAPGNKTQAH